MRECYSCGYEWDSRKKKPKSCPRCKVRLDYVFKEKTNNKPLIKGEKR